MFASGYLNANILKGLTFKSTIGLDINDSREGIYKDRNTIGEGYLGQNQLLLFNQIMIIAIHGRIY